MRVSCGCLGLGMAEKSPDHRQTFTDADADTCDAMTQIMKAQVSCSL